VPCCPGRPSSAVSDPCGRLVCQRCWSWAAPATTLLRLTPWTAMDSYQPSDRTAAAHAIAAQHAATLSAAAGPQQTAAGSGRGGVRGVRCGVCLLADSRGVKTHRQGTHHIQVWCCPGGQVTRWNTVLGTARLFGSLNTGQWWWWVTVQGAEIMAAKDWASHHFLMPVLRCIWVARRQ